jgi:hypothetical protein
MRAAKLLGCFPMLGLFSCKEQEKNGPRRGLFNIYGALIAAR